MSLDKHEGLNYINDRYKELKEFIAKNNFTHIEVQGKYDEIIFDEMDFHGRQFMIIIPLNPAKKGKASFVVFRDDLTDIEQINESKDVDYTTLKQKYDELIDKIENMGVKFYDSTNGKGDYYKWYDLAIPMKEFSESKLLDCVRLWNEFNNEMNEYI